MALALPVGLATGLLAVALWQAIPMIRIVADGPLLASLGFLQPYVVVLAPALGGLLVGLIALAVPEVRGLGVPWVMAACTGPRRALRPIVALAKPLATALTIGTGGSAGPEGAVVHGGAALAEALSTALGLSPTRRRALLACASAGAIAATLDTPLAGLAFAVEIILGGFSVTWTSYPGTLAALLVSTVSAVAVRHAILGPAPLWTAVSQPLTRPLDLLMLAVLGLLAGVVAVLFSWLIYVAEDIFGAWRLPAFLQPAVGGLVVGIVVFLMPLEGLQAPLLGTGLSAMGTVLHGEVIWTTLALLVVLKVTTTALSIGSGGSGDLLSPGLVVGGALGATWGQMLQSVFPGLCGPISNYALAGMAAVVGAAIHAPITAIILGWELMGDVSALPALIIAVLIARWVAGQLDPLSAYTTKLARLGLRLHAGRDAGVLDAVTLADALGPLGPAVPARTDDPALAHAPVAEPQYTLTQALSLLDQHDADRLLVVDPACPGRLLGVVRRADIQDLYRRAATVGLAHFEPITSNEENVSHEQAPEPPPSV